MSRSDSMRWLLDSDPALRWQFERDLVGVPRDVWEATRALVATEGFGARLLALQDPDGQWAGGAFFPKGFDFQSPEAADGAGQPWVATTWTLNSLREWGLDSAALAGTAAFAGIALPNDASIGLHEAVGFTPVGIYRQVGWKLGAWRDVGWWQRLL